jgi:hypothetical protein
MSKESRKREKLQVFFQKPDTRTTQEKVADGKAKRDAAQAIGVNPGNKKRKK